MKYEIVVVCFLFVALAPVSALAKSKRLSATPASIHGKRIHKFRTDGRCRDPKTRAWIKGCS